MAINKKQKPVLIYEHEIVILVVIAVILGLLWFWGNVYYYDESCERDSDCGWVSCCSFDYRCMRNDALSCPDDVICAAYIEPLPTEPCTCIGNECIGKTGINEKYLLDESYCVQANDCVAIGCLGTEECHLASNSPIVNFVHYSETAQLLNCLTCPIIEGVICVDNTCVLE